MGDWVPDPYDPTHWHHIPDDAPPMDAQSRAYREMTEVDVVEDQELAVHTARTHPPLDPDLPTAALLLLPTDYEQQRWDRDRTDPRP